jgi:hypothetical protein
MKWKEQGKQEALKEFEKILEEVADMKEFSSDTKNWICYYRDFYKAIKQKLKEYKNEKSN